jgi:chromosome segregation ATPase
MYRTPGRSSNGGRSSRGSSPQSNYGSYRTSLGDGQDRVIKHLRKEVSALKCSSKGLSETTARLTNMQHKYNIILTEKLRDEETHRKKEQEQEVDINRLLDDVRIARERLNLKEEEVNELRGSYSKLEHNVTMKEEILNQLDKDLAAEYEQYQAYCEEKARLDADKTVLQKQQNESFSNAEVLSRDIEAIKEQVTKLRRTIKEHRTLLQELKVNNSNNQSEIYKVEEDLKNLVLNQRSKENNLNRLDEKARVIESDIALLDSERENIRDCMLARDDTLKSLAENKAEHMRRETALTRDKMTVEQALEEADRDLQKRRDELAAQENDRLTGQTELKGLRSLYDRLMADNRKLVEGLRIVAEADDRAARGLERSEKVDHIIMEATREIGTAMKIIRD